VGYQLTDPLTRSTFVAVGLLILLLVFPILLRWHHPLLLVSWNITAVLFFLPGRPSLWLGMTLVSLGITILQRTMNRSFRYINVPQLTWPLVLLVVVTLVTARLTGGIGIRALGGDVYGGRRYIYLLGAILGYFALAAHRIPKERAALYVGLFFLGGLTSMIGDLFAVVSPSFNFIFWVFPPNVFAGDIALGTTRLAGICGTALPVFCYMLSRYGIRGIFSINRPWRIVFFLLFIAAGFLGGFRALSILLALTFLIQFFLEGLHRTRMLPGILLGLLLATAVAIPVVPKLPFTFQRALAFLPLKLDPMVLQDAEGSTEWRVRMWKAVLPEVPKHLLLGKGYSLSAFDYDFTTALGQGGDFAENWSSALAGDYHNGPLSVIIPFGIWGAIAFLWFVVAALRVLYANYRYCDPALRTYNAICWPFSPPTF
jgi:hypothetical protein